VPRSPGTRADTVSTVSQVLRRSHAGYCNHLHAVVPAVSGALLPDDRQTTEIRYAQHPHLINRRERNCSAGPLRFPYLSRNQRCSPIKTAASIQPSRVPDVTALRDCMVANCQFEAVISSGERPTVARIWQVPDIQPQPIPNNILDLVMRLGPDDGLMLLGNDAAAVEQAASYLRTLLPPADPA
jgi:hypothetical protein